MLIVAVAGFSSDDNVMRYVLLVLWMLVLTCQLCGSKCTSLLQHYKGCWI